jgi:FkbM family methyltransferase
MKKAIKKLLPNTLKIKIRNTIHKLVPPPPTNNESFSQAGEDRVVQYLFNSLQIWNPTYLDIGANHPIGGNNTFLFYKNGSNGVCIEPDPVLFAEIKKMRPRDACLNVAVGRGEETEAEFYIFSEPSLNTLSKEEAEHREKTGSFKIVKTIKIQIKNINTIIKEHFTGAPDFLSIDVEGLDFEILNSIDFNLHRPIAICAETVGYSETLYKEKVPEINNLLLSKGYLIFADTNINTIFIDKRVYSNKRV